MSNLESTPPIDDRYYRRLGWIVLGSFVAIFVIWGSFAPLNSSVSATGKVIVASNNRIIQHLEGGIVKAIFVKDGDIVTKNRPLIELDSTQAKAQLGAAQGKFYQDLALESRLIAERDNATYITFSPELDEMEQSVTKTIMLEGERREFQTRRGELAEQKIVLLQRILQLQSQIQGLSATINAKTALSSSYNEEVKEWEELYKEQLIDKIKLREVKRQKIMTEGELANAKADVARAKGQIGEMNAQIIAQQQTFYKEVAKELRETQVELTDLRARISALKDTLRRTLLRAPVAGIVTSSKLHTIGGVISEGQPIMEIVPWNEPLVIEGKVAANEISRVHVGLTTEIRFPNFSHIKSLDIIQGRVIFVAPDAIVEEKTQGLYYPVKIQITQEGEVQLQKHHLIIQAGIPADTMIVIEGRTFVDYMIKPLKRMFDNAFNEE